MGRYRKNFDLVSFLKVNESYTYKEICEILHKPRYGGNQKIKQLKEFSKYFKFEKEGKRYKILEIYKTPLE